MCSAVKKQLLLQLQHGLQPAEIADVLGIAPGTVRMRIHRGLAALRKALPAGLAFGALALFPERGLAAVRAYYEWMPIRELPTGLARRFRFGELADLMMLDTRIRGRDR